MNFQAVKGTRDFYPDVMRLRNWIVDAWRRVSLRNGFEEYDAPIFEYLDLFTIKSGAEIASQLFSFEDRGGRKLAIRPEMTPSLARMVNAKINSLPRPIKWFSVPRVCRAENPQKGRLREFFQWNIDIIGSDDILADAECLLVLVDFLREMNLTPQDVQVRIGSRPLTMAMLRNLGVGEDKMEEALAVLDKRPKVSPEAFAEMGQKVGLDAGKLAAVCEFQDAPDIAALRALEATTLTGQEQYVQDLVTLWGQFGSFGIAEYCTLDLRIVRGLAYYTGIVYEVFDAGESLRAVAGGGRYDNLLEVLGGPKVGATGFGMGDVVLGILLEEKGKVPESVKSASLDYFVIDADASVAAKVLELVAALRAAGRSADFSYKRQAIGKQFKAADQRKARTAVIVEPTGQLTVKDLATGQQRQISAEELLREARDLSRT